MANESLTVQQNAARMTVIGKSWSDTPTTSGPGGWDDTYGGTYSGPIPRTDLPVKIAVTTQPNKTEYEDMEMLDFTGMVVTAYDSEDNVWTSEQYPDGTIPLDEIVPSIWKAVAKESKGEKWSDRITNWTQPIKVYDAGTTVYTRFENQFEIITTKTIIPRPFILAYECTVFIEATWKEFYDKTVIYADQEKTTYSKQTGKTTQITRKISTRTGGGAYHYTSTSPRVVFAMLQPFSISGPYGFEVKPNPLRPWPDENTILTAFRGNPALEITLYWQRPEDGEILTCQLYIHINVIENGGD